jgi:hypothetical protein
LLLFLQKKKSFSFLFFSEEKNQKTFVHCLAGLCAYAVTRGGSGALGG